MTNSYDVDHGLSQDAPGPLGLEAPDDTLARTGNTARDQEMYVAGIRTGEENAKDNAAIRAGVPDGWKLVPIEPTDAMLDAGIKQHRCEQGDPWYSSPDLREGDCRDIYAAMLNAAPSAPGVSTVEDERQAFEAWAKRKKMPLARIGQQYDDFWVDHAWNGWQARAALDAPAAGDAQELLGALVEARRELHACQAVIHYAGRFGPAYVRDAQAALKRADAAIVAQHGKGGAAQRKGDA
ncbi:hypothetical protein ACOTF6_09355 [Achromobacter xylosoxidans]